MIRVVLIISIFIQSKSFSFNLRYNNGLGIIKQSFLPRIIEKRKVYISKNCKDSCMATKSYIRNKCESKKSQTVMAVKESGDFVQLCLFRDSSSYIK